jgi:chaperonin GroES
MKIRPLSNRVLIKREKFAKTKGGILLPETAKEKPQIGEVIAVGPGMMDEQGKLFPLSLKVGDKILFSSYAGTTITKKDRDDEELLVLSEDDILAILE